MEQREPKRRENIDAAGWPADDYSADLGHGEELVDHGDATEETRRPGSHELTAVRGRLGADADRLVVLREGTRLEQGSTYVDLADPDAGPFTALAGQQADPGHAIVSKKQVDHELWNRLVGRDAERDVVRPDDVT